MTATTGDADGAGGDGAANDGADDEAGDGRRQLRLLGAGFVLAGAVTLALADAADPRGLVVALLGFLGFSALVLEWLQEYTTGLSVGLLTGGVAVYGWPLVRTGDAGYAYLGGLMVAVGLVNVLLAPVGLYFRRLGERLGERTTGKE